MTFDMDVGTAWGRLDEKCGGIDDIYLKITSFLVPGAPYIPLMEVLNVGERNHIERKKTLLAWGKSYALLYHGKEGGEMSMLRVRLLRNEYMVGLDETNGQITDF